MRIKSICLFVIICTLASNTKAQNCDPWITKIYKQFYGANPSSLDCNIRNYNNGSWNGYDQLKGLVRSYAGNGQSIDLAKNAATGNCTVSNYYGICKIAEFTNFDFQVIKTTCGQAAAVTALWHVGLNFTYNDAGRLAQEFYKVAPPKITVPGVIEVKGGFGTDWRQIEHGLNAYDPKVLSITGKREKVLYKMN